MQSTNGTTTDEALHGSRIDFAALFQSMPGPMLLLAPDSPDFTIIGANDAYLAVTGRTRAELIGRSVFAAFPEDARASGSRDAPTLRTSLEQALATRQPHALTSQRHDVRDADGCIEERWWDILNAPLLDDGGEVTAIINHVTDATSRMRAEAARQDGERELQHLTDALPVLVSYIDQARRYRFVNKTYEQWFGYPADELSGRHMREILGDEAYARLEPAIDRALSGERLSFEGRVPYRDAGTRDVHVEYVPRKDESGRVLGTYALIQDIGDRVRAEREVRESEARFRNVADHAPVMMWVTDQNGNCTYLNKPWYDFTGQTEEEAAGLGWLNATHPDDSAEAERIFLEANAARAPFRLEYRLRHAGGGYRWAIDAASPRFDQSGGFLGYVGSVIDISDRRESENALSISEERLRLATDAADLGFWDVDVVHDVLIWPPRVKAMFGISADVPVGMSDFYEGLHPDDQPETAAAFAAACDPQLRATYDVEYRTIGKEDGIVRWVAAKGRGIFDADGRCVRVVGTAIDITERRRAQDALRESEARLRFLSELDEALRSSNDAPGAMQVAAKLLALRLRASRCAYADVDADSDQFFIRNDYSAPGVPSSTGMYSLNLFGPRATADMRQGRTLIVRDVPRELAPGEGREMFQSIGIDAIICCPLVKDDRLVAMMAVHQQEARDWQEDEIRLVQAVVDRCWAHVERVGAEARLRESEARYRTLFTAVDVGFCVVEMKFDEAGRPVDYRLTEINPAFERQTGLYGVSGKWVSEAAPGLEAHWFETYGRVALSGEPARFENYAAPFGRWYDVHAFRTGEPGQHRVAILFNDITERKLVEDRLRDSEARLQAITNSIDQMVWSTRPDGFHDYFNDRWYDYTGVPYGSTDGESWNALFHPDDQDNAWSLWRHSLETGEPYHIEYRLRHRSGTYRWVLGRAQCVRDNDGRIVRWFGTCTDIQEIVEAREVLARSREELEMEVLQRTAERNRVWEMSRDLLAIMGFDGFLKAINPAWETTLGRDSETLLSLSFRDQVHPDDHLAIQQIMERLLRGETVERFEDRLRHADGSWRWISWTLVPEGEVFYAVGRDVTAEREAAAELEIAQEALRQSQKMEAMGQLTGGVAHDFNNLLTPIVGALDLLQRRGIGGEREQRLISGAAQSADRAKTLVQRLLAFARRQPLQATAVDIAALTRGMAELVASTTGPQIKVVVDAAPGLPAAKADPNQLEMAILNLAVNARDAMPDGGTLRISASAEQVERDQPRLRRGRYVRLSVADTGIGMDEATLARAIEPFFSTKGIGKGTGLGLSMVHGLASQLGGELLIHSQPGMGTNIEFWLPASTSEVVSDGQNAPAATPAAASGTALLVDDEELVRASTADMLEEMGHRVVEADSAEAALRLLDEGLTPDLLVTDHLMPGMTGTELAREVGVRRPGVPMLIVSGYAEAEDIAPDLPRLTKPFSSAELGSAISEAKRLKDGIPSAKEL